MVIEDKGTIDIVTSCVEDWPFLARCGLNRPGQPFGLCLGMVRRPLLDNGL